MDTETDVEGTGDGKLNKSFLIVVTVMSTIGGFLFGYVTGVVSGAIIFIKEQFALSTLWQEAIISITIFAGWLFAIFAGFLSDTFGRKPVIIVSSMVFVLGSIVLSFSSSKMSLLVGRFVVGVGVGLVSAVIPVYNAEVAPKSLRGRILVLYDTFVCFGQFVAAMICGICSYDYENGWRYMLGVAAIPAFIQFVGFFSMPETPRYLAKSGQEEKAVKVMTRAQPQNKSVRSEVEAMRNSCKERNGQRKSILNLTLRIVKTSAVRKALILGCCLQIFQQIIGINTVMYYTATIIQISGVSDKSTIIWLSAVVAFVHFACNFISFCCIDKFGRRLTLLLSLSGVIASLIVIGAGFHNMDYNAISVEWDKDPNDLSICNHLITESCHDCVITNQCSFCYQKSVNSVVVSCLPLNTVAHNSSSKEINCNTKINGDVFLTSSVCPSLVNGLHTFTVVVGLMMYLFFFSFGMGPLPWVINAEIYPLWARGVCTAIATSMNWLFNLFVSMTFLTLTETITKAGTFYLYAGFGVLGLLIFIKILPETKSISLEETDSLFSTSPLKSKSVDAATL